MQFHGEDRDEDDAAHELGQTDEGQRAYGDRLVEPGVSSQGGDHAQEDAQRHVEGKSHQGEHEGVAQPLEDHAAHRLVHADRGAPVAADVARDPALVLRGDGLVEAGIGWLIGGLIITESVYSYPGIGRLLLFAITNRDLKLVQATALLIVIIYVVANFVADIIYALLNPRIRYQ